MSQIINPDSAGKERTRLTRALALAVRQLGMQADINDETRDLAAFLVIGLEGIAATIEPSLIPWEKRGYWVKADKFRMEWMWADSLAGKLRAAVSAEDWAQIAVLSAQLAQKLGNIKIPANHRIGRPWAGANAHFRRGK
jgi:hypothetical protein